MVMMNRVTYHVATAVQIRSYDGVPMPGECGLHAAREGCGPATHSFTVSVGAVMLSFDQLCDACTEIVRAELLLAVE